MTRWPSGIRCSDDSENRSILLQQWPGSEVFHTGSGTVDNGRAGSGRWPKWRIGNTTPYPAVACACIIACALGFGCTHWWRICRESVLIESNLNWPVLCVGKTVCWTSIVGIFCVIIAVFVFDKDMCKSFNIDIVSDAKYFVEESDLDWWLTVVQVPYNCKSDFSKRVITAINLDTFILHSPSLFHEFSYRNFNNEAKCKRATR